MAKNLGESQLTQVWQQVLNTSPIGKNTNFFEIGTSLQAVLLFTEIEKITGKAWPLSTLLEAPTIAEMAKVISQSKQEVTYQYLVPIQRQGTKAPFFCVHTTSGNILSFYELGSKMGTERPFYGLQAKGLLKGQTPNNSVRQMALDYLKEIRNVQPKGPYFLGGMCLGAFVALKMAQQLQTMREEVAMLVLIDTPSYQHYLSRQAAKRPKTLLYYTAKFFHHLVRGSILRIVYNFIRFKYFKNQEEIVSQAHSQAMAHNQPQKYGGPTTYILPGQKDFETRSSWFDLIPQAKIQTISSEHGNILESTYVDEVAKIIKSGLNEAQLKPLKG